MSRKGLKRPKKRTPAQAIQLGFRQLISSNVEANGELVRMNELLHRLVELTQRTAPTVVADLERGLHNSGLLSTPVGYNLRSQPTSFKLDERGATTGLLYSSPKRQDTGFESATGALEQALRNPERPVRRKASRRGTHLTRTVDSSSSDDDTGHNDRDHASENSERDWPFKQGALPLILQVKVPDLDEYKAHFQARPDETPGGALGSGGQQNHSWKTTLVACLNATAPTGFDEKKKLLAGVFDEYAEHIMCSLYLSETTHPYFEDMSQSEFEMMHAPRLYELLETILTPYIWWISRTDTSLAPDDEKSAWETVFRIICGIGVALQRAMRERSDDYDYHVSEGEEDNNVRQRFDVILRRQNALAGLFPEDQNAWRYEQCTTSLIDRVALDFLTNMPGSWEIPVILSLAKYYHGATYVPQPGSAEYKAEVERKCFELAEARRPEKLISSYGNSGSSATFEPIDVALESLQAIRKEWSIVWTSNLSEHLWVQDFKIFVYWCPTALLHRPRGPRSLTVDELRKTYGLIFASTGPKLAGHRQRLVREVEKYSINGRPLRPLEKPSSGQGGRIPINPLGKPFSGLLATWLETPCPHHIAQMFAAAAAVAARTSRRPGPAQQQRTHSLVPEMTISELLAAHQAATTTATITTTTTTPKIPEDLVIQLEGILLHPHKGTTGGEAYAEYPYFGERLRHLDAVVRGQKPRGLSELWRDQRDSLQWWTFWLVVWFGAASVLLALGSLVTGVAQTWAAFRALDLNIG